MTEPKDAIKYLTFEHIEIAHNVALKHFRRQKEPIGRLETAKQDRIDAALNLPRQSFFGFEAYPAFAKKAAVLWYSLDKAHAFVNGNKRIALISTIVFLTINGYKIPPSDRIFELAKEIALSKAKDRDAILQRIEDFIEKSIEEI